MFDPDFDFRWSLDFDVGDRFELLKDMYLLDNMAGYDDMGGKAEFWELDDAKTPSNIALLKRIVPAGAVVEIMALKMPPFPYQKCLEVFLRMESGEEWVINYLFEWPSGHYNRELFKKLAIDVSSTTGSAS